MDKHNFSNFSVLMPVYYKERAKNLKMALESICLTEALDALIDASILKMSLRMTLICGIINYDRIV
jgi:hypothetical protein